MEEKDSERFVPGQGFTGLLAPQTKVDGLKQEIYPHGHRGDQNAPRPDDNSNADNEG